MYSGALTKGRIRLAGAAGRLSWGLFENRSWSRRLLAARSGRQGILCTSKMVVFKQNLYRILLFTDGMHDRSPLGRSISEQPAFVLV
jgi:hypothetical protein